MSGRKPKLHRSLGWTTWVAAIVTMVFGLALLIWPGITTDLVLNIAGGVLIAMGIVNIVRYFMNRDPYELFNWGLGLGITLACIGTALIVFKGLLLSIVPLLVGIVLLVGGIVKIQAAFNLRRMLYGRWYLTLIGAAASCVLGVLIICHPFGTGLVLMRLIGASIAIEAVEDLLSILSYDKVVNTYFVD